MYVKLEPFGVCVYGERIGSTWLSLVESILKNGDESVDEGRRRISLQNIRIRSSYQYTTDPNISIPIEIEFGNFYDKEVLIMYCEKNGLDLSKTRTCIKASKTQCGTCPCCWDRRRCYLLAGIEDKTKYLKPYPKNPGGYY